MTDGDSHARVSGLCVRTAGRRLPVTFQVLVVEDDVERPAQVAGLRFSKVELRLVAEARGGWPTHTTTFCGGGFRGKGTQWTLR